MFSQDKTRFSLKRAVLSRVEDRHCILMLASCDVLSMLGLSIFVRIMSDLYMQRVFRGFCIAVKVFLFYLRLKLNYYSIFA